MLADRVKLLEAEVTKLLSDQHLHSPSQANPTPSQSDSAPTPSNPPSNSSQCSSCSQLTSEMQGVRAQLAELTNILHLHLADTEGCSAGQSHSPQLSTPGHRQVHQPQHTPHAHGLVPPKQDNILHVTYPHQLPCGVHPQHQNQQAYQFQHFYPSPPVISSPYHFLPQHGLQKNKFTNINNPMEYQTISLSLVYHSHNHSMDHHSVLHQEAVVSPTLPIKHLCGKDRIPPVPLHKSCTLPQYPAHINTSNLTHQPLLPSLLQQKVVVSPTFPTTLLPCKDRLSLHLLQKASSLPITHSPTHHFQVYPLVPTLIYQHTSPSLFHLRTLISLHHQD